MLRKKLISGVAAALLAAGLFAEEKGTPERDWKMDMYAGFSARRGNTDEDAYRYGASYKKENGTDYRYLLRLDGHYRRTNDRRTQSQVEASSEIRRMLGERLFMSLNVSGLHDDVRDIKYRLRVGPAIGRYLADSERLTADVSTGPVYIHEKTFVETDDILAWRVLQNMKWSITDTLDFWTSGSADANVENTEDFRVIFRAGIDNKINHRLSLTVMLKNEYENLPQGGAGVKKNDFEISTGLRFTY